MQTHYMIHDHCMIETRLACLHTFFRSQVLHPCQALTVHQLSDANSQAWLLCRACKQGEILKQLKLVLDEEFPLHLTGVDAVVYVERCIRIVERIACLCIYNRYDAQFELVIRIFARAIHKHVLQVELADGYLTVEKSSRRFIETALITFNMVAPGVANLAQFFESHLKLQLWSPSTHHSYPVSIKRAIKTVLLLSLRHPLSLAPRHPNAFFWLLPRELLFCVIEFAVQNWYD